MPDEQAVPQTSVPVDTSQLETRKSNSQQLATTSAPANVLASPRTRPQAELVPTLADARGVVVTSTAVSISSPGDSLQALNDFRSDLVNLIDLPRPQLFEDLPSTRFWRAYKRLFVPWSGQERLGYDELIAKYVGLWSVLEKPEAQRYSMQALLGLRLLMSGKIGTASEIFKEIEFQTSTPAALAYVMRGIGIFLRSMVVLSFAIAYSLFFVFYPSSFKETGTISQSLTGFLSAPSGEVLVAAVSGMLGSVVSLLLRLGQFETTKGRSQMFLTLTGATLPVVGGVFGAFIAALLSSKVVNIGVNGSEGLNVWLYVVIGFLSGFSERFSRGFIRIAEQRLGGGGDRDSQLSLSTETAVVGAKPDGAAPGGATMAPGTPHREAGRGVRFKKVVPKSGH